MRRLLLTRRFGNRSRLTHNGLSRGTRRLHRLAGEWVEARLILLLAAEETQEPVLRFGSRCPLYFGARDWRGTSWHGKAAMRISVTNWSTEEADVDKSVAAILRCLPPGSGERTEPSSRSSGRLRSPSQA